MDPVSLGTSFGLEGETYASGAALSMGALSTGADEDFFREGNRLV
jgi:hypothetical protein